MNEKKAKQLRQFLRTAQFDGFPEKETNGKFKNPVYNFNEIFKRYTKVSPGVPLQYTNNCKRGLYKTLKVATQRKY